ncbi:hypothetical protein Pla52o_06960 [Novipirellula galeiformis]|uniref:Uncharacterized protein n=1 Tax=Novipirellula galeiformis TaxID=2528004 RepID=A0A5C6CTS7_9BACT|nr:hypothetical protein [Novipirellula galeiformis]TWU26841.1 hypothetical protein Pla52o_06960 [Novipirellula galeiformis]
MNFLSHALPYFDQPFKAAGTAVPDWLSVVDRKIRARRRHALLLANDEDPHVRDVASGIIQHVDDDQWFHATQAFVETNLTLAVQLREQLPGDAGFRPTFVGHILIEILLDAFWIREDSSVADRYYGLLSDLSSEKIQACVNKITGKPTQNLAKTIDRFIEIRFLYDYVDNDKLLFRLNQVMSRVGLAALPPHIGDWIPQASTLVESRRIELLTPPSGESPFSSLVSKPLTGEQ